MGPGAIGSIVDAAPLDSALQGAMGLAGEVGLGLRGGLEGPIGGLFPRFGEHLAVVAEIGVDLNEPDVVALHHELLPGGRKEALG